MSKVLFDDDYKKIQLLFLTPKFEDKVNAMFKTFTEEGCPVPEKLFTDMSEFQNWKWNKLYPADLSEREHIKEILQSFGLDPDNEQFQLALTLKIFLNENQWPITDPLPYTTEQTKDGTLLIEITIPKSLHVTKEDFSELYQWVCTIRKQPLKKNRQESEFDKKAKYYIMFLETEINIRKGIVYNKTLQSNSPYEQIFYHPKYEDFERQYGIVEPANGENIVSDFRKKYRDLKLVDK